MKRCLSFALVLLLCLGTLLSLAACGGTEKKLIVGFDAGFPPYGYLDSESGEYVGFDIELARLVAEEIGYELELKPIDWGSKDTELESGAINCIWNGFTMNGREDGYTWSDAYIDNSIVVLVADSSITTLDDLAGKIVSVQADSSGEAALKVNEDDSDEVKAEKQAFLDSLAGGNYRTCPDYTTAFTDLKTGAVDALVIDLGVAQHLIGSNTDSSVSFSILEETITTEQYGIGFFKGNTELRDLVNNALKNLDDATVKALAEKYGIPTEALLLWE